MTSGVERTAAVAARQKALNLDPIVGVGIPIPGGRRRAAGTSRHRQGSAATRVRIPRHSPEDALGRLEWRLDAESNCDTAVASAECVTLGWGRDSCDPVGVTFH